MSKYKVLVVDDSAFMRMAICDLINKHPLFEVIGTAKDGKESIDLVNNLNPDIITMDMEMPIMDGLEAIEYILQERSIPIIMLSTPTENGVDNTIQALKLGAFDFIIKTKLLQNINNEKLKNNFFNRLLAATEANLSLFTNADNKLIEHNNIINTQNEKTDCFAIDIESENNKQQSTNNDKEEKNSLDYFNKKENEENKLEIKKNLDNLHKSNDDNFNIMRIKKIEPTQVINNNQLQLDINKKPRTKLNYLVDIVVIGTSTGGPNALQKILQNLNSDITAPIIVVQHMPKGFTKALASRLNSICSVDIKEAENGDILEKGKVYIAPAGYQCLIKRINNKHVVVLDDKENYNERFNPSVNVTLTSVSHCINKMLAIILTGMGNDGLEGCKIVKKNNGTVITESQDTCVVYGMPRVVKEYGLSDIHLPLHKIPNTILNFI